MEKNDRNLQKIERSSVFDEGFASGRENKERCVQIFAFPPKMKKILRFFDQNLWKIDYFLVNIYWSSASSLKVLLLAVLRMFLFQIVSIHMYVQYFSTVNVVSCGKIETDSIFKIVLLIKCILFVADADADSGWGCGSPMNQA